MDSKNRKIINALQMDGRISFVELGKKVHLSAPAVAERVKNLEEQRIIKGYIANIDPLKIDLPITVFVDVDVLSGKENEFIQLAKKYKQILECFNVTGQKAFILKIAVANMCELDEMLESFSIVSQTNTKVVLSQLIDRGFSL